MTAPDLFFAGEVLIQMLGVIEIDPRASLVRILGELRVALREAGELRCVADLALCIRELREPCAPALVLAMTCRTRKLATVGIDPADFAADLQDERGICAGRDRLRLPGECREFGRVHGVRLQRMFAKAGVALEAELAVGEA